MPEGRAFSTSNPVTVAAFRAACDAERETSRTIVAAAEALGKNKGAMHTGLVFNGIPEIVGLEPDNPDDPPEGWRFTKSAGHLVPRQGKAGDEAREWLASHQPKVGARRVLAEHGLPLNDLLGHTDGGITRKFNLPLIFEHDSTVWALYRGRPGRWAGGEIEPTWDERKLSEFYAAREARDAAESPVEATDA